MNVRAIAASLLAGLLVLASTGCKNAPGKPKPGPEIVRPEEVLDFETLYKENCAGCHGEHGKTGASISLANPVYLAVAGSANIERVTAAGVPGTQMPAFGHAAGGMLTDQQISILAHGLVEKWGKPADLIGKALPAYASTAPGDPVNGQKAFASFCARCHGADATGNASQHTGSLVEPAYLALISDQGLRSTIIAGQPEQGMPDWRSDINGADGRPTTDQEITDIVAWLASHRSATPGQPYQQHR